MVPSWYIMLAAFVCVSALGAFMARVLAGDQYRFSHNGSIHLGMLRPKPAVNDFADTHHAVHRWTAPTVMVSRQAVLAAVAAAAAAVMSCMRAVRAVEAGKDEDVYDGAFAVGYAYLFTLILHTFARVEGRQRRNFISSIIRAAGLTAILVSVILWQRAFDGGDSSMAWGRHGRGGAAGAGSRRDEREHDTTDAETAIEREDLAWSVDGEEELDGLVFRNRNPSFRRDDSLLHRGWAVAVFALGSALFTLSLCAYTENLKRCADRAETSEAATRELLNMHDENARVDATEAEVSLYWTFSSEHYAIVCAADVALVLACITASLIIDLTCEAASDSSGSRADGEGSSGMAGAFPIVLLAIVWWVRYLNVWARASFDSRRRSMYTRTLLVYNFISVSLLCCIAAFVALIAHGLIRTTRRIEVIGVLLAAALTVLSVSALCQPPWPTPLVVQMRRSTALSHTKERGGLLGIDVLTCTDAVTMHSTVAATLSAQGG